MTQLLKWDELTLAEKLAIKAMCEESFEFFLRIFFQLIQGQKFLLNWHHRYECRQVERVYRGEVRRLIVNVSPGSTKTEIWSVHFPAWGVIKCIQNNLSSRWLPLSYSDDLVTENCSRVKEILVSEEFGELWPLSLSSDTKGKSDWKFKDQRGNIHRMYGTSTTGQVTGRRAGFMIENAFTGALIADDPMAPKIQGSGKMMESSNKHMNRVVRSRLAHDDVPIIVVQQRIGKGDTTEFLLSPKAPDDYEVVKIPALLTQDFVNTLPEAVRQDCIECTGFNGQPSSYWPQKEPTDFLLAMKQADPYMFSSQYQQDPDEKLSEGVIYRREVELMIEEGRFCSVPIEPSLPVFTFWDLGINDDMVIWLMQPFRKELRMIACYGNNNEGIEHYINWLLDFRDKYKIRFEKHYGPHDLAVRELMGGQGRTRVEIAKTLGISFTLVERCKTKRDSINALKVLFPRIWIDDKRCERGWEALKTLRRAWDQENEVFKDEVIPKWATNYTDALQQMGLYYREKSGNKPDRLDNHSGSESWMGA